MIYPSIQHALVGIDWPISRSGRAWYVIADISGTSVLRLLIDRLLRFR